MDRKQKIIRKQIISWILFSMRSILEETDVRNAILKRYLTGVVFGPTITGNFKDKDVIAYLHSLFGTKRTHIFTVSNRPAKTGETHFQSFIYVNDMLFVGDPAYDPNGEGIYPPYIGKYLMKEAKKYGIHTEWIRLSYPYQDNQGDVFCQSWSLIIQRDFLLNEYKMPLKVPESQDERYSILLEFYKEILSIPIVQTRLKEEYVYNIQHAGELGIKLTPKKVATLLRANPVSRVQNMTFKDLYPDDDDEEEEEDDE